MFDDGGEVEKGEGGSVKQPASSPLPLPPADSWRALSGASEPRLIAITIFTIKMAPSPFSERKKTMSFHGSLPDLKTEQAKSPESLVAK